MFARIIRSSTALRNTFKGISGIDLWWRIVLLLHGKPSPETPADSAGIIRRGFRFYGFLYLFVSIPLLLAGISSQLSDDLPLGMFGHLSMLGSVYLALSSQLAFKGADLQYEGDQRGAPLLVAFFVSIIIFLSIFLTCALIYFRSTSLLPWPILLTIFTLFILFGIGSYMLELLYIVWLPSDTRQTEGK